MNDETIRAQIRGTKTEEGLLALHAAEGSMSHDDFAAALSLRTDQALEVVRHLDRFGLLRTPDYDSIPLSLQGLTLAEAILKSRRGGPERWDAVERAIALAVMEDGTPWRPDEVDGQTVTDGEVRLAIHKLEAWGLIRVLRASNQVHAVRPLDAIHQVSGIDGLLIDYFEGGVSFTDQSTTTHIGDRNTIGGVQTGGAYNTQTVTQTISVDEREEVLGRVDGLLDALERADGDKAELRTAVEDIKAEASRAHATRDSIKARVAQALVVAAASDAGHLIWQELAHLMGALTG